MSSRSVGRAGLGKSRQRARDRPAGAGQTRYEAGLTKAREALVQELARGLDAAKLRAMDAVLAKRTDRLTVVLEDVYQPHNAASVIRSCDYFGVSDLHFICKRNTPRISEEIAKGATDWVRIHRYETPGADNTRLCLAALKQRGYRIAATTLREGSESIEDLDLDQKLALCFGTEEKGLSEVAHELADVFVYIPMYGFTQSLNVSVSVAISISLLTEGPRHCAMGASPNPEWGLNLKLFWLIKMVPDAESRIEAFIASNDLGNEQKNVLLQTRLQA